MKIIFQRTLHSLVWGKLSFWIQLHMLYLNKALKYFNNLQNNDLLVFFPYHSAEQTCGKAMVIKVGNLPLGCKLTTFLQLNCLHLQILKLVHPAHSCSYLIGSATNPLPNSNHTPQSSVHIFQSFWQFYWFGLITRLIINAVLFPSSLTRNVKILTSGNIF